MADANDRRWVRDLSWGNEFHRYEVEVAEDHLQWTWFGPKDLGGSSSQSFESFGREGPLEDTVPAEVLAKVRALVALKHPLPPVAERPVSPVQTPVVHETASSAPLAPVTEPTEAPAPPLGRVLLAGSLVFIVALVPSAMLEEFAPLAARYLSLFGSVLAGFAFARWARSEAVVVAGFFALAAAIGFFGFWGKATAAATGSFASLASVSDAPAHPTASRFAFDDARLVHASSGSVSYTISSGKNSTRPVRALAAPLVPAGWAASDPVPAWVACTSSPGFDCLASFPTNVRGAVKVESAHFAAAVRAAEHDHQLSSAPGAPVLEPAEDPERLPLVLWATGVAVALGLWVTWVTAVLVHRVVTAFRQRTS